MYAVVLYAVVVNAMVYVGGDAMRAGRLGMGGMHDAAEQVLSCRWVVRVM